MGGDVENCTGVVAAGVTAIIEDDDEAAEPSWFSDRADEDELEERPPLASDIMVTGVSVAERRVGTHLSLSVDIGRGERERVFVSSAEATAGGIGGPAAPDDVVATIGSIL